MEERIANWISRGVGGSYIVFALIVLSAMAISKLIDGELLNDPFLLKALLIAILYVVSVVIVATLPGKSVRRRAVSWVTSIVFHLGLLIYLGVTSELGSAIFAVGIVETIILLLSSVGLGVLVYDHHKASCA
jgi:uncharacterized membrane protein